MSFSIGHGQATRGVEELASIHHWIGQAGFSIGTRLSTYSINTESESTKSLEHAHAQGDDQRRVQEEWHNQVCMNVYATLEGHFYIFEASHNTHLM